MANRRQRRRCVKQDVARFSRDRDLWRAVNQRIVEWTYRESPLRSPQRHSIRPTQLVPIICSCSCYTEHILASYRALKTNRWKAPRKVEETGSSPATRSCKVIPKYPLYWCDCQLYFVWVKPQANVGKLEHVRVLRLGTCEMKWRMMIWQYTYLARPAGNETYQNWYVPEDWKVTVEEEDDRDPWSCAVRIWPEILHFARKGKRIVIIENR